MKANSTQQEILLITGTSFASRQYSDKEDNSKLNDTERLENACWNGLLPDMLPEIFEQPAAAKKLYLWEIRETESFIEVEMGEYPEPRDNYLSLDPYAFLSAQTYN